MAKNTAVDAELGDETESESTPKQLINEGIARVVESTGIDGQKSRYKAMRAIAYQAFVNAIDNGTFDKLVDEAIANSDDLPSGWELEREGKPAAKASKVAPAKAHKAAPAKKSAAPAAKTPRRRPSR